MEAFMSIKIECLPGQGIVGATNAIITSLPVELRKQVNNVFSTYLRLYGITGVYDRLNNRTIAEILAAFDPREAAPPNEEGVLNGIRYRLYSAQETESKTDAPLE